MKNYKKMFINYTLKGKNDLTEMWVNGRAPWALWQKK